VEWTPLVLALWWSATHLDERTPPPGPEHLRVLFGELTGQAVPRLDSNAEKR
jgi:hypothetical protein